MDIIEMLKLLKDLGESLADYTTAKNLEGIGSMLEKLGNDAEDPARSYAYRIAAVAVYEKAIEGMKSASAKLPNIGDEDEAE